MDKHDYKIADIAVLLDKVTPSAVFDWNSYPPVKTTAAEYTPTEYEKSLLKEYMSDKQLQTAVHMAHRMSMVYLDNLGINASDVRAAIANEKDESLSPYHRWQKSLEENTNMSVYDLVEDMGLL